jgi:outer membrane protein TolC
MERKKREKNRSKTVKKTLWFVTMFAGCSLLSAQPPATLKECLEEGLENNYAVRIVRNDQQITDNNATRAAAGTLPVVGMTGGYSGQSSTAWTTPRQGERSRENGAWDPAANVGLNATWTLFDGFRIQTEYSKLQELKALGAIRTRITIEDFVASLASEYYNYVQQHLRQENLRYAVSLSRERLRIVEARYVIGSFSRLDLLQARVDFNADSSAYMLQTEAVLASRIRLNELMARPELTADLRVADTMIRVDRSLEWDRLHRETLSANAELLASEKNATLAELDLRSIRSRNYPYVDLNAGYGYNWNRYGSGTTRTRAQLGPRAGLTVGFTLFDGNRRREQRNAQTGIENARLESRQLEQGLMADLANFWQAYLNNLQIIRIEEENLVAARENLEIAQERYLLGDLPGIEMREVQQSLLNAAERILTARYNTKLCEISLLLISGNVLDYLGE